MRAFAGRRWTVWFALLAVLGVSTGCGDDPPRTSTEVDGRRVFVINDLGSGCDDGNACAAVWTIDGREYDLSCRPDLPGEKVALYAVAGRGVPEEYEAWTVEGADRAEALLVPQGEPCSPEGSPRYLVAR